MKPPFSYYGGKQRIVSKIVPYIPKHAIYAEPFCGAATILFAKGYPSVSNRDNYREAINDKNAHVVNFFKQLRDNGPELVRQIQLTPHSKTEHAVAKDLECEDKLEAARRFFIKVSQSFSNMIRGGWRRSLKNANDPITNSNRANSLSDFIDRLMSVYIDNIDALDFVKRWDSPETFFYIDPPYPGTDQGHYGGYTLDDFKNLVSVLREIKGSFILSCYPQDEVEMPWPYVDFSASMSAARDKTLSKKRTERIWIHYSKQEIAPKFEKLFNQTSQFNCFTGGPHLLTNSQEEFSFDTDAKGEPE